MAEATMEATLWGLPQAAASPLSAALAAAAVAAPAALAWCLPPWLALQVPLVQHDAQDPRRAPCNAPRRRRAQGRRSLASVRSLRNGGSSSRSSQASSGDRRPPRMLAEHLLVGRPPRAHGHPLLPRLCFRQTPRPTPLVLQIRSSTSSFTEVLVWLITAVRELHGVMAPEVLKRLEIRTTPRTPTERVRRCRNIWRSSCVQRCDKVRCKAYACA